MLCGRPLIERVIRYSAFLVLLILQGTTCKDIPYKYLNVPEGFSVGLYSDSVPSARSLTVSKGVSPPTSLAYVGSNASEVCCRVAPMPKQVRFFSRFASSCLWVDQPSEPLCSQDESRTTLVRAG